MGHNLTLMHTLTFAALIAAVDPVAVSYLSVDTLFCYDFQLHVTTDSVLMHVTWEV